MIQPSTDCDWMRLQAETLFAHDVRARITHRREPGEPRAPRFFLGRTRHGCVWRLRSDLAPARARALSRLAGREPALPPGDDPLPPPERLEPIRRQLAEDAPIAAEWSGPAFRFATDAAGRRALADQSAGSVWLDLEDPSIRIDVAEPLGGVAGTLARRGPVFAVIEGAQVVSIAYTAAGADGPAREVGVDTASRHRGRGHAGRCVAAWALAQLEAGVQPLYSTGWTNRASLAVARKLGLVRYGEDWHWT